MISISESLLGVITAFAVLGVLCFIGFISYMVYDCIKFKKQEKEKLFNEKIKHAVRNELNNANISDTHFDYLCSLAKEYIKRKK